MSGGAERLAIDTVRALRKLGVVVRLVVFRSTLEYAVDDIQDIISCLPVSLSLSVCRRNAYQVEALQFFINDFKPDIIHTHLFEAEIVSRACYYPNAKWFSHGHDNMYQLSNQWSLSKSSLTNHYEKKWLLNRYRINGGTHFIAVSRDTENYFKKVQSTYPVTALSNAIDYHRFVRPTQKGPIELPTANEPLRIINVGSFVSKKNQRLFVDTIAALLNRGVKVEGVLVGDGPLLAEMKQYAEDRGVGENILFRGALKYVEEEYWQTHIYLHTATYEPFGLVLLEAMAAGLPVVALDGKGNRDVMREGVNGHLLTSQDATAFADKIASIAGNSALYQKMSTSATQFASGYDIAAYAKQLLQLYEKSLGVTND